MKKANVNFIKDKKELMVALADQELQNQYIINSFDPKKKKDEDEITIKGESNGSFQRINDLTEEVKRFLIQQSSHKTEKGSIIVNKDLFLESLLDIKYDETGEGKTYYNFLNERINKKFYNIYNANYHHYNLPDIVSDIQYKIVDHLKDKETIEINFDHYKTHKDDISYILFKLDKEINREILEFNYIFYDRDNQTEFKYYKPLGNFVFLDHKIDKKYPNYELIKDNPYETFFPSENEYYESDLEDERIDNMIKKANLTKRQRETLEVLMQNNFNQAEAARDEGIKPKAMNKMIKRIRDRFAKAFGHLEVCSINNIKNNSSLTNREKIDQFLDTSFNEEDLLNFIKNNIDTNNELENLFYNSGTIKQRKETIKYLKNKNSDFSLVNQHLKAILYNYYNK